MSPRISSAKAGITARLVLCGWAMSVMGRLLAGQAPLRGRASLELLVRAFGYRDAARFWGAGDPRLAVLLHSVVGGTPAYRREFVAYDAPDGLADFEPWLTRTVLNPQSPLFREARYLLAEETDIRDATLYHSVLGAIASGNRTFFGTPVGEVGAGIVNDQAARSQIEVDVAVFAPAAPGQSRRIVSLGEVK